MNPELSNVQVLFSVNESCFAYGYRFILQESKVRAAKDHGKSSEIC